jgi:hypothetical protein
LRKYSIEPRVIICLSVEEVLNRTSCDNLSLRDKLSHEVLLCTSSTERKIITWGSIEYFLNWETNYHLRFYWVLPQLREKLSHEVLMSTSSTERQIITWGSNEYFLNWEKNYHMRFYWVLPEVLNRTSCDNFSLSYGSTQ